MGDYQPKNDPGDNFPLTLSADVLGGRLVTGAGAHAGADSTSWVGVSRQDGKAGATVTVTTARVQRLIASGAIAKNALVKCAADGEITTYTVGTDAPEEQVGVTLEAAAADQDVIAVRMNR